MGYPEYLIYRVLSERKQQDNLQTGRTRIHKLCCLTDRKLKEDYDRDIDLPKFWYKYGRTLEEWSINRDILFSPKAAHHSGYAYYPAEQIDEEEDFDHLDEDVKNDIFDAAEGVVEEHGKKNAQELEELQYGNYAPTAFALEYGRLRSYLNNSESNQSDLYEFGPGRTAIEKILDDMLEAFDDDFHEEIYHLYLEWDDTIRLLHDLDRTREELYEFTERFIEGVAKIVYRVNDYSNVNEETIEEWEDDIEEEKRELREDIEEKREEALEGSLPTSKFDDIAESYNRTIEDELEGI